VALTWDGIAISIPSDEIWRLTEIPVLQHLYDDSLEKYGVVRHRVHNASLPEHVDWVIDHWRQSATAKVGSAQELIDSWSLLFPNLDLCEEYVCKTLPALGENVTLRSTVYRLYALNAACNHWAKEPGRGPEYGFRARPETPKTMENDSRKNQRLATCTRKGRDYFVMHCNIEPKGYRLYWLENAEDHRFCIGYVGPHLETARYKAK